jgi:hypothetical protein
MKPVEARRAPLRSAWGAPSKRLDFQAIHYHPGGIGRSHHGAGETARTGATGPNAAESGARLRHAVVLLAARRAPR